MATMEKHEFEGWVRHIYDKTEYRQEFVVANYKSEQEKDDMRAAKTVPVAFRFCASVKNGADSLVDQLAEGDRVKVLFYLYGVEGVSKQGKYYAINELNIDKKCGVVVLEKAQRDEQPTGTDDIPDDCPF